MDRNKIKTAFLFIFHNMDPNMNELAQAVGVTVPEVEALARHLIKANMVGCADGVYWHNVGPAEAFQSGYRGPAYTEAMALAEFDKHF